MADDFAGPRKIRYFIYLLVGAVLLFVIGVLLSDLYGFTLLESVTRVFVENPMILFELAGMISLIVLVFIAAKFVSENADRF